MSMFWRRKSAQAAEEKPRQKTIIKPVQGLLDLELGEVLAYHELLYFLVWRDIKVRFKQTLLGFAWVLIQPLVSMIIFTFIFTRVANIETGEMPYEIFVFTALLPWNYFASAISQSTNSVVQDKGLVSKVYFPRLITPLAAVISPLVSFVISFVILIGLMLWFGISPTINLLFLPLFILLALITALTTGLFLSALNVRYRDVSHLIPFLVQSWMYLTPVVYPIEKVPTSIRPFYSINPMTSVIEGFRWSILGDSNVDFPVMVASSGMVMVLFVLSLIFFKRMEASFADVI